MNNDRSGATPSDDAHARACARIRRHLEQGAPWDACDAFREARAVFPEDADLLYLGALAHARAGATVRARALLEDAHRVGAADPVRLADILSLRGRLSKDELHRISDANEGRALAKRARDDYLAAFAIAQDPYPGVNAATLSLLLGERAAAEALAQQIVARLAQVAPFGCWDHATMGEALLVLGQFDRAAQSYAAAYAQIAGDAGSVATMRRQLRLLARAIPESADSLPQLPAPDVVAFAGHMIDAPDRSAPRFPPALVPAVRSAMREYLARLHTPIVYASAACGADLMFIEGALEVGAEVNVVLPFNRDDFVQTSVAVGGDQWVDRFDAALARATRVIMATDERHLGDDILFEHAARLLEGFTILRAAQLETLPTLYCVIDAGSSGAVGGTHASFERWSRRVGPPQLLDLRQLRTASRVERGAEASKSPRSVTVVSAPSSPESQAQGSPPALPSRPQRSLKTLLFADFTGFSRVHDAVAPFFQESFWKIAAGQIAASPVKPLLASTWGDALYVVFDAPRNGAAFALSFLENMLDVDWAALGLSDASPIRIALHAGPVFRGFDPIIGRDNYFGSSVTKAARIEPVTPPGIVYTSEAFAASLAAEGHDEFSLEYMGRLALAKGYGESRIYRLGRGSAV
jgi:tetratricopeptide (TPR) repeat protein